MLGGLHNVARPLEGHADGLEIRRPGQWAPETTKAFRRRPLRIDG
jgi:hypothetical protein